MSPATQNKPKKIFVGNKQGKRICGYKLVGYETITKNGQSIKRELRKPIFEGQGKYKNLKLPESFLREFMLSNDQIPNGLIEVSH
jgi:hypothetical protein